MCHPPTKQSSKYFSLSRLRSALTADSLTVCLSPIGSSRRILSISPDKYEQSFESRIRNATDAFIFDAGATGYSARNRSQSEAMLFSMIDPALPFSPEEGALFSPPWEKTLWRFQSSESDSVHYQPMPTRKSIVRILLALCFRIV